MTFAQSFAEENCKKGWKIQRLGNDGFIEATGKVRVLHNRLPVLQAPKI